MIMRSNKYQPSTQHGNADGISQLLVQEEPPNLDDSSEIVCALEQ